MGRLQIYTKNCVKWLITTLLTGLLLCACGKSDSPPAVGEIPVDPSTQTPKDWVPLDVSDVAFLWPRLQGPNFNQLLPITGEFGENSLLPNTSIVDTLINFSMGRSNTGPTGFRLTNPLTGRQDLISTPSDSWARFRSQDVRVVSVRIGDCGAGLRQDAHISLQDTWVRTGNRVQFHKGVFETCEISMRLVAQPISGDNAIHLIYTYKDANVLAQMMDDLQSLKKASPRGTNGAPLGVHPGLAREGGIGPFSEKVKNFIVKFSLPSHLEVVAFLATNESAGGGQWNFFEAKAQSDSNGIVRWQANNLNALQGSPISQGFTVPQSDPTRKGPPSIAHLDNGPLDIEAIEANFDPRRSFTSATDCKSCHLATQLVARTARTSALQFNQFFRSSNTVMDIPGITSFPRSEFIPTETNNFRAFGWFQRPTVSAWVAMKSGTVAASLNKLFLGTTMGPGYRCSGNQHLVMRCLLQNAGQQSNCLERICKRP